METYSNYNPYPQPAADGCLDWDAEISQESSFVLLEEGDYPFTVEKLERGRYNPKPGSKIPPCNQVAVTFDLGEASLTENFLLHTKMEWKLSALYAAIGMKQKGEPTRMNWPAVPGRTGFCHVGVRTWKKEDGTEGKSNEIRKFYAPWDKEYPAIVAQAQGSGGQQPQAPQPSPQYIPQPAPYTPQQQTLYPTNPNPWQVGKF